VFESSREQVKSFLGEHLVSGEEKRYCCPWCSRRGKSPDTGFHLYLNLRKRVYLCHRCGAKGSAKQLLEQEAPPVIPPDWFTVIREKILHPEQVTEKSRELVELEFPTGCVPALQSVRATEYLKGRRLTVELIQRYDFRYQPVEDRIYCPTFELDPASGKVVLVFWTGRYLGDSAFSPKYKNPPKALATRRDKLFGYHFQQLNPGRNLYITEGIFSALAAGEEGVATFGKKLTLEQIAKLTRLHPRALYICLDGDASLEASELARTLSGRLPGKVFIVPIPLELDPGDLQDFASYAQQTAIQYDQWGVFQYALLVQGWQQQRRKN